MSGDKRMCRLVVVKLVKWVKVRLKVKLVVKFMVKIIVK